MAEEKESEEQRRRRKREEEEQRRRAAAEEGPSYEKIGKNLQQNPENPKLKSLKKIWGK